MSRIKIAPNDSGTGIFTIESPNSNTNRTISIPDNSGIAITTGSPGTIIQTQYANFLNNTDQTTSSTFQDSTVTLSITPSSATNKILITWAAVLYCNDGDDGMKVRIKRTIGATDTFLSDATGHNLKMYAGSTNRHHLGSDFWLDSPATTSSITYTMQYATYNAGAAVNFGNGTNNYKSILLQEVVA